MLDRWRRAGAVEDEMYAAFGDLSRVELLLYTDTLASHGFVRTRKRRVSDILNFSEAPFLVLEDVTVREHGSTAEPMRAAFAQINLDAVLFAIADTPVEPSPELVTPKVQEPVLVSVPPFTVVGMIHLLPTAGDLRQALTQLAGRFLPVTGATYWSERVGEARQPADVVAVNRHRAQILAPHTELDPWTGLDRTSRGPSAG
jgi:hypothetical protein